MEEKTEHYDREPVFAKAVRAGKRTYFFDVRATRGNDLYLTITESKRKYNEDGTFIYNKHKVFLYKEDFGKFTDALGEALRKVGELQSEQSHTIADKVTKFSDVNFDDLGGNGIKSNSDSPVKAEE